MSDDDALGRAVKVLGPLEARIMRAVWSGSVGRAFTVRVIQEITPELAYTTLMTTLSRLAEKGVLTQSRVPHQRAFDYRSAGSPSDFLAKASREQANRLLERFGEAALAAFAAQLDALPAEHGERLRRAARSDRATPDALSSAAGTVVAAPPADRTTTPAT